MVDNASIVLNTGEMTYLQKWVNRNGGVVVIVQLNGCVGTLVHLEGVGRLKPQHFNTYLA